jgi:hypothetical protein
MRQTESRPAGADVPPRTIIGNGRTSWPEKPSKQESCGRIHPWASNHGRRRPAGSGPAWPGTKLSVDLARTDLAPSRLTRPGRVAQLRPAAIPIDATTAVTPAGPAATIPKRLLESPRHPRRRSPYRRQAIRRADRDTPPAAHQAAGALSDGWHRPRGTRRVRPGLGRTAVAATRPEYPSTRGALRPIESPSWGTDRPARRRAAGFALVPDQSMSAPCRGRAAGLADVGRKKHGALAIGSASGGDTRCRAIRTGSGGQAASRAVAASALSPPHMSARNQAATRRRMERFMVTLNSSVRL